MRFFFSDQLPDRCEVFGGWTPTDQSKVAAETHGTSASEWPKPPSRIVLARGLLQLGAILITLSGSLGLRARFLRPSLRLPFLRLRKGTHMPMQGVRRRADDY